MRHPIIALDENPMARRWGTIPDLTARAEPSAVSWRQEVEDGTCHRWRGEGLTKKENLYATEMPLGRD
jgi:hypothetical protein